MSYRRNTNKPNQTGRNNTDRFARLPHRLLNSHAYRSLSPNDRALLLELTMMENGSNNGSISLSVRNAADRMGIVDMKAVCRSFDTLVRLGFIEMTRDAHFRVKVAEHSRARCWRLTWLTGPGRKTASWKFLEREPEPGTRAHKRMVRGQIVLKAYRRARETGRLPVVDSATLDEIDPIRPGAAVENFTTPESENGGNLPKCRVGDSSAYTAVTMGNGAHRRVIGWFEPDWTAQLSRLTYSAVLAGPERSLAA